MKKILFVLASIATTTAFADIYKCPQSDGSISLTNQVSKAKGCEKMVLPPAPRLSNPTTVSNGRGDTKTIIETTNTNYDKALEDRKRIIQEEINLENQRLLAVYDQYKTLPYPADKRNPEQQKAYEALQEKEKQHKVNLKALKKELDKTYKRQT